jgi:hypothetical protein
MPYRTRAAAVLERWREIERRYRDANSFDERVVLREEMERLRKAYQSVVREAQKTSSPQPPPFPDDSEAT